MAKVTFDDKVDLTTKDVPEINKITADNINQLKNGVNSNEEDINSLQGASAIYQVSSDAEMLAKYNEVTPTDGSLLIRDDFTPFQYWLWDSTETNKGVYSGRDVLIKATEISTGNTGVAVSGDVADYVNLGYILGGTSTPTSNPGTPTRKIYYHAFISGTYTNFLDVDGNPITIDDSEVYKLRYNPSDGYWKKITDNIPSIALLNSGYLKVGKADLNTNPNSPKTKVFYETNLVGKYDNFLDENGFKITKTDNRDSLLMFDPVNNYWEIIYANSNSLPLNDTVNSEKTPYTIPNDLEYFYDLNYTYTSNTLFLDKLDTAYPAFYFEGVRKMVFDAYVNQENEYFIFLAGTSNEFYTIGLRNGDWKKIIKFTNNGVGFSVIYSDDASVSHTNVDGETFSIESLSDRINVYVDDFFLYSLKYEDYPLVPWHERNLGFVKNKGLTKGDFVCKNLSIYKQTEELKAKDSYDENENTIITTESLKKSKKVSKSKSITLFGDSITAQKYYISKLLEVTGISNNNLINEGVSGSTVSDAMQDVDSLVKRVSTVSQNDTDVYVVFAGTNDWHRQSVIDDNWENDPTTYDYTTLNFKQAYNNILQKLIVENPTSLIVVCTPLQRSQGYKDNEPTHPLHIPDGKHVANPTTGVYMKDIRDAVIEVADYYGVVLVDLWRESGICYENMDEFTLDGLHPNNAGGAKIGQLIGNAINSNIVN